MILFCVTTWSSLQPSIGHHTAIFVWPGQLALFQLGLLMAVCLHIETQLVTMEVKKGKIRDVES